MATICKFKVWSTDWTRDHWSNKSCDEKASDIFEEVKSYIGFFAKFNYRDWYSSTTPCTVTITNIELDDDIFIVTEETDIEMPKHYVPCPWKIINKAFGKKDFEDIPEEERKDYYASLTYLSPKSCSRL